MTPPSVHRVTADVAALVAAPVRIPAGQLDAALSAHAALLNLLQKMHHSLTGFDAHPTHQVTLNDIERSPVKVLGELLHRHPYSVPVPLTHLLDQDRQTAWHALARHATLALQDWPEHLQPGTTATAAWSGMADVAALAHALALLDHDLAASLNATGRLTEASTYRTAERSGLRIAAQETLRRSRFGPLDASTTTYPQRRAVLTVPVPAAIPMALDRLTYLVTGANLTPTDVDRIRLTLSQTALVTANSHRAAGKLNTTQKLRRTADHLAAGDLLGRRIRQLDDGDVLPRVQAERIDSLLASLAERRGTLPGPVAHATSEALGPTLHALALAAHDQMTSGRWHIVEDSTALTWRRCPPGFLPQAVRELTDAAHLARTIPGTASQGRPIAPPSARSLVADVIARRPGPERAPWPGRSPRQLPGR